MICVTKTIREIHEIRKLAKRLHLTLHFVLGRELFYSFYYQFLTLGAFFLRENVERIGGEDFKLKPSIQK